MTNSGSANIEGGVSPAPDEGDAALQPRQKSGPQYIVLTGNPNCGKTTLFNALTGLRAKVGNYAGVTVERKEGRLADAPADAGLKVLDLPGAYSLSPQSLDEQIARDVLLHRLAELPAPSLVVVVVDASNLQRNLYYATQVLELGYPTLIALNMIDVAEANGHQIDTKKLSRELGVPVLPLVASSGKGVPELKREMLGALQDDSSPSPGSAAPHLPGPVASQAHHESVPREKLFASRNVVLRGTEEREKMFAVLPEAMEREVSAIAKLLPDGTPIQRRRANAEAALLLGNEKALATSGTHYPDSIVQAVTSARRRLEAAGVDWRGVGIETRYASIMKICQSVVTETQTDRETFSDKLDRVLTHKVWGTLIFVGIMALMFQSIFSFAKIPMDAMKSAVDWFGGVVGRSLGPGDLNSLLVDGVIEGVGAVVVFLPQILLLFLFIGLLEDTGYMARAAFLMDRLMSKVGLHGKSFIPMLSSFACAIPGIMATRTIESPKDRLVTILVAPLMSCSARLPVYALLIGACIPHRRVFGIFGLQGLTLLGMYLLGIVVALGMAWLFKKTLLKGETPMLIMELPPYKRPLLRTVLRHMWDRSWLFVKRAGTVILGIMILLWFLATYPRNPEISRQFEARRQAVPTQALPGVTDPKAIEAARAQALAALDQEESGEKLRYSFAGRMGRLIEPAIAPLGFDWKIGIGIVSSFAAREVFVSTMSTVYNLGSDAEGEGKTVELERTLREQKRPDGTPVYTTLTAVTLMVFYVLALQCASTVAVVRRETNSWKWPLFQWVYMGGLAWILAFITYQGGKWLGW